LRQTQPYERIAYNKLHRSIRIKIGDLLNGLDSHHDSMLLFVYYEDRKSDK